jgi:RHS repeat-associated protein
VVEELSGAGAVQRAYTYGVQRISQNQVISNSWTPSFYGYDGGGTVRALTNAAGAVTDSYEYDAFGNGVSTSGSTPNNYLYRGEAYDSDLGLYYLRARYYDPLTGRFMSRDPNPGDPFDPKTLHKYLYASGDPVNMIDPSGRDDEEEEGFIDLQTINQTVRYADALRAKDILLYECSSLALQGIFDKMFNQDFTGKVPYPIDAACLFLLL